jgi:hypothetical protein
VTNTRAIHVYNGQLYVSSQSGSFRLATVGAGTPTTSGQTITNLPGFPTATGNPHQFFFADLDATVPGVDVVYVADETGTTGGFQKFSLVSGNWVANGNITVTGNNLRGITGVVSGTSVTLYGTNPSAIFSLTDNSGYNATITGTVISLATAATNTAFRGISLTPDNSILPVRFTSIRATKAANGVKVEWTNSTETDVVNYTIERSTDGRNYSAVATVAARANNGNSVSYQHIDASAPASDVFYRIKGLEVDGKITYSSVVRLGLGRNAVATLAIYPNPVKGIANLQLNNLPAGTYQVRIISDAGQVVNQMSFTHAGGSVTEPLLLNGVRTGGHTVQVSGATTLSQRFIVQ